MNWNDYLKNLFNHSFFDSYIRRLTETTKDYFYIDYINEEVFLAFYYTNLFYYYGYQNDIKMRQRYYQIPKEKKISRDTWNELHTQMCEVPPFKLHMYEESLVDITFFKELVQFIMSKKQLSWEEAAQYMSQSHIYDVFVSCGREYIFHHDVGYWGNSIIDYNQKMKHTID